MNQKTLEETKKYEEDFHRISALLNKNQLSGLETEIEDYFREAIASNDREFVANAHYLKGARYVRLGELQKSVDAYKKAQECMLNSENIKKRLDIENNLGNAYRNLRKNQEGLDCYFNALNLIAEENKYNGMKAGIINNIGFIYQKLEDYDNAINFYLESHQILKEEGMKDILPLVLFNLSTAYFFDDDFVNSKIYIEKSIQIAEEVKSELDLYYNYLLKAFIEYRLDENLSKLKKMTQKSVKKIEEFGDIVDLIDAYTVYLKALIKFELYDLCKKELDQVLPLLRDGEFYEQYEMTLDMAEECYKKSGDYKKAYEILQEKSEQEFILTPETSDPANQIFKQYKAIDQKAYVGNLENSIRVFKLLSSIGEGINLNVDIKGVFNYITEQIYEIWQLDVFGMAVVKENQIDYYYQSVGEKQEVIHTDFDEEYLIMVHAIKENLEIIIRDTNRKGDYINLLPKDMVERIFESQLLSLVFLPLVSGDEVIGGITIQSRIGEYFGTQDVEMLRTLAAFCTSAIINYDRHMKLEKMKDTDGLTGVENRHALKIFNDKMIHNSETLKMPMLIAFYDVDYFKGFNDEYGHLEGDQCLIVVSKAIESLLEPYNGHLFRYGGDEFTIICEDINEKESKELLASLVSCVVDLKIPHKKHKTSDCVTISLGAILIHEMNQDYTFYYEETDKVLYEVKKEGRNGYKLEIK
jgi:diguanylate cyclase (GGDEF)-like protein